jgi:hypothetical protein
MPDCTELTLTQAPAHRLSCKVFDAVLGHPEYRVIGIVHWSSKVALLLKRAVLVGHRGGDTVWPGTRKEEDGDGGVRASNPARAASALLCKTGSTRKHTTFKLLRNTGIPEYHHQPPHIAIRKRRIAGPSLRSLVVWSTRTRL